MLSLEKKTVRENEKESLRKKDKGNEKKRFEKKKLQIKYIIQRKPPSSCRKVCITTYRDN